MKRWLFSVVLIHWAKVYIIERTATVDNTQMGDACWQWLASNDGRYGHAYFIGGRIKSHVLAYLAWGGKIKRKQVVDHLCNTTLCCNPRHLEAKSQSANMKRCFAEGRGRSPFLRPRSESTAQDT